MARKSSAGKRWSQDVTEHGDALDLEKDVFALDSPRRIAQSLKKSAEASKRRKTLVLSLGDVDADLLPEPRRQEPAGEASQDAECRQG